MPRTAIYTPEEIKKRKSDRVNKYITERRVKDPEYAAKLCESTKRSIAKRNEEFKRLKEFYEANKNKATEE